MRTPTSFPCLVALLLASVLLSNTMMAQVDYALPQPSTGFWGSVHLASGGSSIDDRQLLISDFRKLLVGTVFSEEDLGAYRQNSYSWGGSGRSRAVVLGIGIHPFRNDERSGPELRMGFTYVGGTAGRLGYDRTERYVLDTLMSSSTGMVFLVDSTFTSRYDMGHDAERFGLDASLIFRSSGRSRWSVYGGVGLGVGARFNARTWVNKAEEGVVNYPGTSARFEMLATRYEQVDNSGGVWVAFHAPIGVGFRLSKRNNLLGRMDLYLEGRPGMLVQGSTELGTITSFGSQSLFGLRFRLD